jgi:hypothetical protein
VHHESAREIEHAALGKPAAAPNPMRHRHIDEQEPERRENEQRPEAQAFDEGANHQRRRDDGERHLEHEEHGLRDRRAGSHGVARHAEQKRFVEIADPVAPTAEGETVGANEPQHRGEAGDHETVHQHREQVLGAHEPAIEQSKPRQRHEQNERRGRY